MGRCIDCGFSDVIADPRGAYKLMCLRNGMHKREGDGCPGFWEKNEMKECIDRMIPLVEEK